jgi:hypothetical protein
MNAKCAKQFPKALITLSFLSCELLQLTPHVHPVPSGEKPGLVSGAVLDEGGIPVEGATIIVTQSGGTEEGRTVTDSGGHYSLKVNYGDLAIVGVKENDAYPDCHLTLFSCFPPPYHVNDATPSVVANLKLRRAAWIKGRVVDRMDGKEIAGSTLLVRRADDFYKAYQVSVDSTFSILVPSDVELTLSVTKLKYRIWNYRDLKTNYATLRLGSGAALGIVATMDRVEP